MTPGSQLSEQAGDVIELILERREHLAREMTERIPVEIPEYGQADTTQFGEMLFESCSQHVDGFVHYLRTGELPRLASDSEMATAVLDRVRRGIRLDANLHAFRVGQSVFWDEILKKAGNRPETALEFAGPSMDYIDHVCNRIAAIYLQTSHRLRSDEERAGRDLLEALLDGSELDGRQARMVETLGMSRGSLIAVTQSTGSPGAGRDELQRDLTRALAGSSAGALVVARQNLFVVLLGLGSEPASMVVEHLSASLPLDTRCGISTIAEALNELGQAFDEALAALRATSPGQPVIALTQTSAFQYLVVTAGPTVERVVDPALLALLTGSDDRAQLAETARAFLECDLSIKRTSERLFIHANTLRYRLEQIEEKAGIDLRRISDLIELRIALNLADRNRLASR